MNHHDAMGRLKANYSLSYTHNPGGGEFYHSDIADTCQIGCQDDKEDFERLIAWLKKHDAEKLDEALAQLTKA